MSIRASATVRGRVVVSEASVLTILDEESQRAEREAMKLTRGAVSTAAPLGPGRHGIHLKYAFRYSVRRRPYGYQAQLLRAADAWYGRIVEGGRQPGVSRYGRRYPGAPANPFVEHAVAGARPLVDAIFEQGGVRVGERIAAEVVTVL